MDQQMPFCINVATAAWAPRRRMRGLYGSLAFNLFTRFLRPLVVNGLCSLM